MANSEIDLNEVHQAIIDGIADQFPDFETVTDYHADRKGIDTPACFIELVECNQSNDDPGTEQLELITRWEARIVIGFKTAEAKREIRKMITSLASFIHLNRWDQPIGPAEVMGCFPDDFSPVLDQYEIWRVEWTHTVHFGETTWTNDGTIPSQVFVAYEPDVGDEDDYKELTDEDDEETDE